VLILITQKRTKIAMNHQSLSWPRTPIGGVAHNWVA